MNEMGYDAEREARLVVKGREFIVRVLQARGRSANARLQGKVITIRIPPPLGHEEFFRAYTDLKASMLKKLERMSEEELDRLLMPGPRNTEFYDGEEVKVLGNIYKITVDKGRAKHSSTARLDGERVVVKLASGLSEDVEAAHISNLARRVIAKPLTGRVRARMDELNERHFGFTFGKVSIKEQSTKWGSCSSNGNINLNFKLLLAPQGVLDYVMVHELAHIREHNHSGNFWQLVARAMPDYAEKVKWLKEKGDRLGVSGRI